MKEPAGLGHYIEKGLTCPFVISRAGVISAGPQAESVRNELVQTATVLFETISTLGSIKIDTLEIVGKKKGLFIEFVDDHLIGDLFDITPGIVLNDRWRLVEELRGEVVTAAPARPKEKARVKMEAAVLENIKSVLTDYLGDFAPRIFQNQIKTQRINADEFYDDDGRRLILALGKAAGMIIGPSKGSELTNKLLKLLK